MADLDTPKQERWTNPETGLIVAHPYERSPYSGAGNCWCGRWEIHRLHIPLDYPDAPMEETDD
jgi:hypothetical protein